MVFSGLRTHCRCWLKTPSSAARTGEASRSAGPPPCWRVSPSRWRPWRSSWGSRVSGDIRSESSKSARRLISFVVKRRLHWRSKETRWFDLTLFSRRRSWRAERRARSKPRSSLSALKRWRFVKVLLFYWIWTKHLSLSFVPFPQNIYHYISTLMCEFLMPVRVSWVLPSGTGRDQPGFYLKNHGPNLRADQYILKNDQYIYNKRLYVSSEPLHPHIRPPSPSPPIPSLVGGCGCCLLI